MANEPRRVLFVLANGGRGGMQSQVRLMAAALTARGCEVTVAVGGGGLEEMAGVRVVELPPLRNRRPWVFWRSLRCEVNAQGYDVVHAHGMRLAPLLKRCAAPARVVSCHGLDPRRARRTITAVRLSPVTFVSCGEGPRALLARYGLTSRVLNNALGPMAPAHTREELHAEFGLREGATVLVLPARYSEQKNHELLLDALRRARSELGEDAPEVLCFGDGPLRVAIDEAARATNGAPLAHCLAYRDDAIRWLGASDFFVLPSRWEGQPLVVLEALARNLAVVTTCDVGVEDLIVDGRNGRRVSGAQALSEVIVDWTRHRERRVLEPAFSAGVLAAHHVDVVAENYLALYRELLDRRR